MRLWSFPYRKYILVELLLQTKSIPSASWPYPPSLESVSVITGIKEGMGSYRAKAEVVGQKGNMGIANTDEKVMV